MNNPPVFLSAEWRHLLMVNYAVDPAVLESYLPRGTELDVWNGTCYLSLVAFNFLNTRVKGLAIPGHRNFEEINLRFYVRRKAEDGWRRGVVFIKEIVPRRAIAWTARHLYNENYHACPTRGAVQEGDGVQVKYEWKEHGVWQTLAGRAEGPARPLAAGSEAQFIAEHYWGYSRQRNGDTVEYRVEHPSWNAWAVAAPTVKVDVERVYGAAFVEALGQSPVSSFIADGSAVTVSGGGRFDMP